MGKGRLGEYKSGYDPSNQRAHKPYKPHLKTVWEKAHKLRQRRENERACTSQKIPPLVMREGYEYEGYVEPEREETE